MEDCTKCSQFATSKNDFPATKITLVLLLLLFLTRDDAKMGGKIRALTIVMSFLWKNFYGFVVIAD